MARSKLEQAEVQIPPQSSAAKMRAYLKTFGPGLITGASDDDPSGIGTYAQTGALFGYTQLWMALYTFPLAAAIQEICARIALQTGMGLAENIRKHYPRRVLYGCVFLLVVANTINVGADLGAMAASAQLLLGIPYGVWLISITLLIISLEVFIDYKYYAQVLRFLTLSLFAYILAAFVIPQDWGQVVRNTLLPTLQLSQDYFVNLVAILGTTIAPYLFFWQANQEIEEEIDEGKRSLRARKGVSKGELKWMRTDVISGMFFSNFVMWCIIITTASTLFKNGVTNIDSAPQAAQALRPVAGNLAYALFAAGIIGTGLLAVPVLAGSAAYAVAETFRLKEGLFLKLRQAHGFYAVIAVSTLVGAAINLLGINPIQALYFTAVINGIVAPPLLVMIMLISRNHRIMGNKVNGRLSDFLGWLVTIVMTLAAGALVLSLISKY